MNSKEWRKRFSTWVEWPPFIADLIADLEDAEKELNTQKQVTKAIQWSVAHTAGGIVEGYPTSDLNYLQRIRQLVEIEKAAPDSGLRKLWGERCGTHDVRWCGEDACKLLVFDRYLQSPAPQTPKEGDNAT